MILLRRRPLDVSLQLRCLLRPPRSARLVHTRTRPIILRAIVNDEAHETCPAGEGPCDRLEPVDGIVSDGRDDPVLGSDELGDLADLGCEGWDELRTGAAVAEDDDFLVLKVEVVPPASGVEYRTLEVAQAWKVGLVRLIKNTAC